MMITNNLVHDNECVTAENYRNDRLCQCKCQARHLDEILAPFTKKIKALKKIKNSLSCVSRQTALTSQSMATNNLAPLLFHPTVFGDYIQISLDGTLARRTESFCNGICFSSRPVKLNERIFIKFSEVSDNWSGVLRLGFTNINPLSFRNELPKYACPDLTAQPGCWGKALPELLCVKDNMLYFYVNNSGDVRFGINCEERDCLFGGVNVRKPLYAIFDIYGNTAGIRILNNYCPNPAENVFAERKQQSNFQSNCSSDNSHNHNTHSISSFNNAQQQPIYTRIERPLVQSVQSSVPQHMHHQTNHQHQHQPKLQQQLQQQQQKQPLPLPPLHKQQHLKPLPIMEPNQSQSMTSSLVQERKNEVGLRPLRLHETCGQYVRLNRNRDIAFRSDCEFCQGYIFSEKPIAKNTWIVLRILKTDPQFVGSLAMGLTFCDPSKLNPLKLPKDSHDLLDRDEYWIIKKNLFGSGQMCNEGDTFAFKVNENGAVSIMRNFERKTERVLMHVDKSLSLWIVFDLFGSTVGVQTFQIDNAPGDLKLATAHKPDNVSECVICCETKVNAVFYTCGHMCMCFDCAQQYWKNDSERKCPLCRALIRDVIKIFYN